VSELRFPTPPLRRGAILLRPWRTSDLPAMVEGFSDPLVHRFSWPKTTAYTRHDADAFLIEQEQDRFSGKALHFAIEDTELVVGGVSLYDVDSGAGRAAIGYWLAPVARGQGIATSAVQLVARWALHDLSLDRLEITCAPDNAASQRVAERSGFVRQGVLRSHLPFKGGRRDSVIFGLAAEDR
jgi:RimJ/RimL family protein N-acetyltransferase